uniref:Inositol polyphosphate-related phosphatase domain-containing protein n=1 Tax=Oryza punctata TaxID=4537 RepID=A0A0E0LUV1_ORYPU
MAGEKHPSSQLSEILRPGLVAGKLLRRRRLGRLVSELADVGEDALQESYQSDTVKYRVFAGTWNVAGVAPPDDLDLDDWLDGKADDSYDIYVLGLQEIVPLNARNVLGPTKSSAAMKWNSLIGDALNRFTGRRRRDDGDDDEGAQRRGQQQQQPFRCVVSEQMVGIFVSVWARSGLRRHVRHATASCVGAGVLGRLGNKGAVSVRFLLHGTSFCFVCCHLASGGKDGDAQLRNADAADILSRTTFRRRTTAAASPAPEELPLPRKILDHDRVVLLGDLNYRIAMDDAEARLLVRARKWSMLLENDELLLELAEGGSFDGWREGLVTFSPTYKYHLNSDMFYWSIDGAAAAGNQQQRAPAWCDRILWRGKGMRQVSYERCGGYRLSDHRPVRAVFDAVCELAGGGVEHPAASGLASFGHVQLL